MGTTNILDLNNRLTKVEKENVAQNSYTSLKNKPKINSVTLTGNKTLADIGAAAASDVGDITLLNTTDKSSCVGAINELKSGLTSQLEINVTLPATTDGRSSVQLPDAAIPAGAKVVGYIISDVSTYSDGVSISVYFIGRTARVTMVSNMNVIPQITLKLIVDITY